VIAVRLNELGDQFRRYRLRVSQAIEAMVQSLRRWGQCAPIVATLRQERPQVLDGFTRWEAAHEVRGMTTLLVRLVALRDPRAKGAIYGLNQTGRRPYELSASKKRDTTRAVCGSRGHSRSFLPFPRTRTNAGLVRWKSAGVTSRSSWMRVPVS